MPLLSLRAFVVYERVQPTYIKHAQNSENAVKLETLVQLAAGETGHVWLVLFIRKSGSCQSNVETSANFA
jgi:hypothetical protein